VPATDDHRARPPFVVWCPPPGWGFFANFFWILDGLSLADRNGWCPVVDMQQYKTRFNERRPVHGSTNAWEYYFEQPGGISLAEAETRDAQRHDGRLLGEFFWTPTDLADDPRVQGDLALRGRLLIERYVRVRPDITASVDAVLPDADATRTLGVHVRGTDMRRSENPGHPIPPPARAYLDASLQIATDRSIDRVYLACDETETVDLFHDAFGSRLVVADAYRVSTTTPTGRGYDWWFGARRPLHRYRLGREVLVDALAMSRCAALLCGASNVALAATMFATRTPQLYTVPAIGVSGVMPRRASRLRRVPMVSAVAARVRRWLAAHQRGGPPQVEPTSAAPDR
jgi:hypothetical protein